MSTRSRWAIHTALALALGLTPLGCIGIAEQQAAEERQLLSQAGFRKRVADTPEKLDHLQTLPQRKVERQEIDGDYYYIYADAAGCECMYTGRIENYRRFQTFGPRQASATDQKMKTTKQDVRGTHVRGRSRAGQDRSSQAWHIWGGWD